jgi:hypothetical protein
VSLVFVSIAPLSGLLTLNLDAPPLGTTSTRLELGFSQESSSSSVAACCLREDGAHALTDDYAIKVLIDRHQLQNFVPNCPGHQRVAATRGQIPQDFRGKNISRVLIIHRKQGMAWTACPAPPTPGEPTPKWGERSPPQRETFGDVLVECEVLARRSLPHMLGNEDDHIRVGHILQSHVHISERSRRAPSSAKSP